ncbi:hypothetical protein Q5H93_21025 [Hymenobacter sp. ASUV-10]|uniref:DUF3575 domain-containing protein n=1 Tax=Hymenobacter aranciens TaxID=3063996 RepID=A0ABT9BJR1_9BACT|nr:hypothetical protein [Hymenobacter sp. ASUV-10]MDO7877242.1 hypothetical protein [Hymenobacter sp. ASUV-10]
MKYLLLILVALGLGSCTVYAPMQCAAPNIRDKGEVEVAATLNANFRAEGAVTYSPVKHVLVRAAGGFRNNFPGDTATDTTFFRIRQYEVAAGGYWCPQPHLVVGILGGYGQAHNRRGFVGSNGWFGPDLTIDERWRIYDARYHTIFGEGFAVYQGRVLGGGGALRITDVQFDELTNRDIPVGLGSMLRVEPMGFIRFNATKSAGNFLYVQIASGVSWTSDNGRRGDVHVENVREGNLKVAVSLLFYPHQLWR